MTGLVISESFIIRIYRVDTGDCRKLPGLVEAMDGERKSLPISTNWAPY